MFDHPNQLVSDLCTLISQDECEYLDFKSKFQETNIELLHDILCLANSYAASDRYLVFGVQDVTKEVIGVQNDQKRKKSHHIQDLLRQSYFNRIPTVSLRTIIYSPIHNIQVDVLIITNRPDKPFFLTKDKEEHSPKKGKKMALPRLQ